MARQILKVESAFRFPDFAAFVTAEPAAAEKAAYALRRVIEDAEAVGNDGGRTGPVQQEVEEILKCMDCEHFKNAPGVGQKVCPQTGQKRWKGDPAEGCSRAKFKVRKEEVITC